MDSLLKSVLPTGTDEDQFLNDVQGDVASSLQTTPDESIQELLKKAKEEVKAEYDTKASEVHALHKKQSEELHDRISDLKRQLKVS